MTTCAGFRALFRIQYDVVFLFVHALVPGQTTNVVLKQRFFTVYLEYQHWRSWLMNWACRISWQTHTQTQKKKYEVIRASSFASLPFNIIFLSHSCVADCLLDSFTPITLASPLTILPTQWWLWVQHRSIATIKFCSRVLKPLAIYHWIILPATYQPTLSTHISTFHAVCFFHVLCFQGRNEIDSSC